MLRKIGASSQALGTAFLLAMAPAQGAPDPCGFARVPGVKVNTDGTRISYNADDPRAQTKAINDIRNAYRNPSHPIQDFEKIRDAGWQPTSKVWDVLSSAIIEKDKRPGKEGLPCLDEKNYLVSMTAIRATASRQSK